MSFVDSVEIEGNNLNFDHDILNAPIAMEEVDYCIRRLKLGKAPGIDRLTPEIFKNCPFVVKEMMCKLFNAILNEGVFPADWARGIIAPIHKKGDVDCVGNYRGITLLPIIGKIFRNILDNRFHAWLEENSPIVDEQAGFRKTYCTSDNIFILKTAICNYLAHSKGRLYIAFIDFEKAFDRIDHYSLFYKLINCGVKGKFYRVIINVSECYVVRKISGRYNRLLCM